MFTGIIEEMGTILEVAKGTHSAVLTIAAGKVLEDVHIGDSIAVNGVCLTVTSFDGETFTADVMHETLNGMTMPCGYGWRHRRKCFGMWWRKARLP